MSIEDAIQFANDRPTSCDDTLYQWAVDAEDLIRGLATDVDTRQQQENLLVRILDVALNGEAGAAPQASLCDIVSQARAEAAKLKRPLLKSYGNLEADLPDTEDMAHSAVQEALCYGLSHHVIHTWMRAVQDQTVKAVQAQQPAPSAAVVGDNRVPEAWTNVLAYVLQDKLHNRLTPRVIDIAYTAFMQAKRPNDDDGGASDWFNDTRPMVRELIAKLRKDLIEELAGAPQPSPAPQADSQPAPQGETNAQLDTDSNPPTPGQQRDVAGPVALGQPVGNGSDQAAGHTGAQGDKLLTVAERNLRRFLETAVFRDEADRQAALNCLEVLTTPAPAQPGQEVQEPYGWLYDWTHSSATGKPDTSYTGFTKDFAHAQKHDNCIAVYTAQQLAPKASQQAAPSTDQVEEILRERDDAEDFIDALLDEVLGHERPEWSSAYGRADALNDVRERMTALHKPAVDKAWDQFQSTMAAPQQPAPSAAAEVGTNTKTAELLSMTVGLLMGYREGGAQQPYKPGSVVDKTVAEAVEHLKDWPYPEPTPPAQAADSVLEDADPLQGAANWLAEAHGQFGVAVLQGCLMIGYNRAKRLHDAAIAARKQGGA